MEYTKQQINEAFMSSRPHSGENPFQVRKDHNGIKIAKSAYMNFYSEKGWEIKVVKSECRGSYLVAVSLVK